MAKVKKTVTKKTGGKKPAAKTKQAGSKKTSAKLSAKPARRKIITKAKAAKKPLKKTAPKVVARPSRPAGLPEQLRDAALKVLNERQAEEIVTFDMAGRSSVADYLIIASGRASRQLAAIAHYLGEAFAKLGVERTRVEGLPEANWVLVDGGDVIIHLFLPDVRNFYNIESIWNKRG